MLKFRRVITTLRTCSKLRPRAAKEIVDEIHYEAISSRVVCDPNHGIPAVQRVGAGKSGID